MGPKSYDHRTIPESEQKTYGLSEYWYADPDEVDNFLVMVDKGEISYPFLERVCEQLDYKLNVLSIKPEKERDAQEKNVFPTLQETIERLKPYRKRLKEQHFSGEIDLAKEGDLAH